MLIVDSKSAQCLFDKCILQFPGRQRSYVTASGLINILILILIPIKRIILSMYVVDKFVCILMYLFILKMGSLILILSAIWHSNARVTSLIVLKVNPSMQLVYF